ncbi:MAG: endolytic transglycosylase MltG [Ferruginibacter sp.]
MKKALLIISAILGITSIYSLWSVFGPTVSAPTEKFFYVRTGSTYNQVTQSLKANKIIKGSFFFNIVSKRVKYNSNVKAGKYEIKNGMSIVDLVRMLKSGRQSAVRLVINKLRTKEDLAGRLGQQFEIDSLEAINFITSNDSLKRYHVDTNTVMTLVIPNSYLFWWNTSLKGLLDRLADQKKKFWLGQRTQKAAAISFTPDEVYTIASIVEEETNKQGDKGLVASVYMNRVKKGMRLEADPTVKYALRDFGLKRILHGHLDHPSLYNTYLHTGLPPGPICTASINTIDAVLDAPQTDYIFFVAKPDFNGYSNFAATYPEHLKFAKAYQHALDSLIISRIKN